MLILLRADRGVDGLTGAVMGFSGFSRVGEWGYIMPAFQEGKKRLNAEGYIRFHAHPNNFLNAFKKI